MPPILPLDPIWQYVVTAGLVFLGQVLQAKGANVPILTWLLSFLHQPAPAPGTPAPSAPAADPLAALLAKIDQSAFMRNHTLIHALADALAPVLAQRLQPAAPPPKTP